MPTLTKQILRDGTYKAPEGDVVVTPARRAHWAKQHANMAKAGLRIPVGWDHSNDPAKMVPIAAKNKPRSAKDTAGYVTSMKPVGDALEVTIDIPRQEDFEKAKANLAQISPIVYESWPDGAGRKWDDILSHVDLVNHPVDATQTDFVPTEAVACSLIRMSLDSKPVVYRMSEEPIDCDGDGKVNEDSTPPAESDTNPDMPKGDGPNLEAILAHLSGRGIALPSDTDESNFYDRLLTALMTAEAMETKQEAEKAEEEPKDDEENDPMTATNPQFAAMSLRVKELEAQAKQHRIEKQTDRRQAIFMSLDSLVEKGQCKPADIEAVKNPLKAIRMSLDAAEEATLSKAEMWVEARKDIPEGTFFTDKAKIRMSTVTEPGREYTGGEPTHEEAEAIVDQIFGKKK